MNTLDINKGCNNCQIKLLTNSVHFLYKISAIPLEYKYSAFSTQIMLSKSHEECFHSKRN